MRSPVRHPREPCSIPSARMTHHHHPCALHWTFHKTGLNAAPLRTHWMFLYLHPASQIQLVYFVNLIFSSKTIYRDSNFLTLKHLNFAFKNQRLILKLTLCELTPVRKYCNQVWKQRTNPVLLDSLASCSSQLTRETLQNRLAQKTTFSNTNFP